MGVKKLKIVVVGDGSTGKTCLLEMFANERFIEEYSPCKAFDNFVADMTLDGKQIELSLWDTSGTQDYDKQQVYTYPTAEVVLICFSIDNPTSFSNIPEKWLPDVKKLCQGAAVIIVGSKKDLRDDQTVVQTLREHQEEPVSLEQGRTLAHMIGAFHYLECSALQNDGIREVFLMAAKAGLKISKKRHESSCVVA